MARFGGVEGVMAHFCDSSIELFVGGDVQVARLTPLEHRQTKTRSSYQP